MHQERKYQNPANYMKEPYNTQSFYLGKNTAGMDKLFLALYTGDSHTLLTLEQKENYTGPTCRAYHCTGDHCSFEWEPREACSVQYNIYFYCVLGFRLNWTTVQVPVVVRDG